MTKSQETMNHNRLTPTRPANGLGRICRWMVLAVLAWGWVAQGAAQVTYRTIDKDPVAVDGGRLSGTYLPSGVKAYLGVPFAAPPVRENRWREPQPVQPWKGIYVANRKAPECIQPLRPSSIVQYFGEEATSEDCLYLNLWAPGEARAGAKLPVVVWIYGGAYTFGSASAPIYGGEFLAKKGVIYVAANYRLGVLGFMAHPDLSAGSEHHASGNWGLLDQVAALRWIQRNIAAFGGDPANVTIAGQSAGALSINCLQVSPLGKGLFAKIVGMSGTMVDNPTLRSTLAAGEADGVKVQKALKAQTIEQMRAAPADQVAFASVAAGFRPALLIDGWVLPKAPEAIFAAHQQNDVPALIGSTADDLLTDVPLRKASTPAEYRAMAEKQYGADVDNFLKIYPADNDEQAKTQGRLVGMSSGLGVWTYAWAQDISSDGHAPVWLYRFSHTQPVHPGVQYTDFNPTTAGAFHSADVPYWLTTLDTYNLIRLTRDWTHADRQLETEMSDVLVAFARTGNPSTPAVQLPRFDPTAPKLTEFGDTVHVESLSVPGMKILLAHPIALTPPGMPGAQRPIY